MPWSLSRRAFLAFVLASGLVRADTWQGVERIVAIGDVHGDYDQFITVLRHSDLIDSKNKWSGGKTHLVQLGDIPDRGPSTRKIMDLLMDLEKQARKAGGMVHVLIGNHDAMNVYGDLRYTTLEEFASFRDGSSEQMRDRFFEMHVEELKSSGQAAKLTAEYRREWEKKHPLGYVEHRFQFGPNGKYGKWIQSHNTVVRINDTLFLHGGLSPKYAKHSREEINKLVKEELRDIQKLNGGVVLDDQGPLWYRGLARDDEASSSSHLEMLLQVHGVKRIVLGHTPTDGAIVPRFGGKVLLADVGMSASFGSRSACLVIQDSTVSALHRGKRLALPDGSTRDLIRYYKEAAAADPAPSPLNALVAKLESSGQ